MRFISVEREVDQKAYTGGLKVICAGLPRCATTSLQNVLENDLGFGPCMHMAEVAPYAHKLKLCHAALLEQSKRKRHAMLHELFDGYASTADFPGMAFVEDLIEMYPDAKLILNQRKDGEMWAQSISKTLKFFSGNTYGVLTWLWPTDYWHRQLHLTYRQILFETSGIDDFFSAAEYEHHNSNIRNTARRLNKKLLEYEPSMGFAPLCDFLDVPTPKVRTEDDVLVVKKELPRLNDEKQIKILIAILCTRGILAWTAVLGAPVLGWWGWTRFGEKLVALMPFAIKK